MKSLRKRLPVLFTVMLLPVLLFTAITLWVTARDMRERVLEANRSALSYYVQELDTTLSLLEDYLLNFAVNDNSVSKLHSADTNARAIAKAEVFERLRFEYEIYGADCIFFYCPSTDCYITVYSSALNYQDARELREMVTGGYEDYLTDHRWKAGRLAGDAYLYQIVETAVNGPLVYGALIDIAAVQERLSASPETAIYMTGPDGQALVGAGTLREEGIALDPGRADYTDGRRNWMVIQESSQNGFILWETFPQGPFLGSGSTFPLLLGLSAIMLLVLAGAILLIRRWVLRPLSGLEKGIRELSAGNLNYQISPYGVPEEYARVNSAFNQMTGQIRDLKIQVYEEKLRQQQAELNFLYMQMRPHFFLNALTTIVNFGKLKQYENMYQFIGYLGRYIRYSLRRHASNVPLREEVAHIENYLDIVGLQSPGSVMLMADIQEEAQGCRVLPFSVYTFVENSVKHALSPGRMMSVFLSARVEGGTLAVTVEDDGAGFTEEALAKFRDPAWIESPDGQHIGIRNIIRSLSLMYGEEASVFLSNAVPSGARVELRLPAEREPAGSEYQEEGKS